MIDGMLMKCSFGCRHVQWPWQPETVRHWRSSTSSSSSNSSVRWSDVNERCCVLSLSTWLQQGWGDCQLWWWDLAHSVLCVSIFIVTASSLCIHWKWYEDCNCYCNSLPIVVWHCWLKSDATIRISFIHSFISVQWRLREGLAGLSHPGKWMLKWLLIYCNCM